VVEAIKVVSMQEFKALKNIQIPNKTTIQMLEVMNIMLDLDVPDRNFDYKTNKIDP